MLLQMASFHSPLWLSNIPLYMRTTSLFTHLTVDTQVASVSWLVNSAAVNIGVHVSFQIMVSLDILPGVGLQDYMIVLFLVFFKKLSHCSP